MAMFMSLWAVILLELWKRSEADYRVKWGQEYFNETEGIRPQFNHDYLVRNAVDASRHKYFSSMKFLFRSFFSRGVVLILV